MAAPNRQAWVQSLLPLATQWEGRTGIPAAIWIAMAASESNWGSTTGLFGIKGSGTAGSQNSKTWESVNGQRIDTNADFAAYNNPNEAFQAFWDLMHTPYYASALAKLPGDPSGFLHAINAKQYATDQTWASMIERTAKTTIGPMIQTRGGTRMGQMQDPGGSTAGGGFMPDQADPEIAAIIAAAANGTDVGAGSDTSGPGTGASADPNEPTPAMVGGTDGLFILEKIKAIYGDAVSVAQINAPTIKNTDPITSLMTPSLPNPVPVYRYTWSNGKYLDLVQQTGKPAYVKGGTAVEVLSKGAGNPEVREFPDHSLRERDPSKPAGDPSAWTVIAPAPGPNETKPQTITTRRGSFQKEPGLPWTLIPGTEPPGGNVQIHTMPDGSLQQYDPDTGAWTLIQNRYVDPTEEAYKKALTANTQANTAKTMQGLRPTAQAAIEDYHATVEAIKKAFIDGTIKTPKDMQALADQAYQGLTATLAGTTLFEQQKQAQDTASRRAQTATDLLNQRVQSSASLGASLFQSATGHVLMPKGQTSLGIDPLAIANQEVDTQMGGSGTGNAAAAFLKSVFGGGAPATPGSGAPGMPNGGQFPTTREGVLAMYPHLGQAGQPTMGADQTPANFVTPKNETPVTPNGNIATLLASIGQGR